MGTALFLRAWWKEIVIALVVVGGFLYVTNLQHTVTHQAETIAQQKNANDILSESNKVLTSTVTVNNKTIAEMSKGAAQTKEDFVKLNERTSKLTTVMTRRLKDIMKRPIPVTCDDTIKYLIDAVPTYGLSGAPTK